MLITDEPGRHIEASADNVADIRGNQTVVLPVSHGKQLGASQPKLEVNHLRTVSLITWKHGHRRSMPAGCRACGATRARLRHPPMCRRGGLSAWSQPNTTQQGAIGSAGSWSKAVLQRRDSVVPERACLRNTRATSLRRSLHHALAHSSTAYLRQFAMRH